LGAGNRSSSYGDGDGDGGDDGNASRRRTPGWQTPSVGVRQQEFSSCLECYMMTALVLEPKSTGIKTGTGPAAARDKTEMGVN
jgi:hypothetical protein